MSQKTQVDHVLARIDPARATAIAKVMAWLDKPEQTVRNWVRKGFLPQETHRTILKKAREDGVVLTSHDFVHYLDIEEIAA